MKQVLKQNDYDRLKPVIEKLAEVEEISIQEVMELTNKWRYELLERGICLCDEKSAKKMEKILDAFLESAEQDYYPEMEGQGLCFKKSPFVW